MGFRKKARNFLREIRSPSPGTLRGRTPDSSTRGPVVRIGSSEQATTPDGAPRSSSLRPGSRRHSPNQDVLDDSWSLWDRAYDTLRSEDPDLVDSYEKILSRELKTGVYQLVTRPQLPTVANADRS